MSPFCGATDTPVLDFWWCLIWVSNQSGQPYLCLAEVNMLHIPSYVTSGAAPVDLLVASMAVELFSSMYLWAGIGQAHNQDLSSHQCLIVGDQVDALPTDLWRFRSVM